MDKRVMEKLGFHKVDVYKRQSWGWYLVVRTRMERRFMKWLTQR